MADIQYLNYGDQQIEQQALLNSLANNVQQYVQNQSWSKKRKDKFMSAYSDLMNRGLLGASNTSGQWVIDVNGDPLPFDSMDQKDREMYQEAAYFIQQQMAGLPTKASQEEKAEEDKSKLPIFEFNNSFKEHVNKSINGGNPLTIGGTGDQWNYLDERDPKTGLRGRGNRAKKLAELLESYKTKVVGDGSKFNFEGSSYDDVNDFNTKIDTAIAALRTPEIEDDRGALQAIGLNQADWFNNGSGDPSGQYIKLADGTQKQLSYAELNEYNQEQAKIKEEENAKLLKKKKQEAYNNTLFFNRVTNPKMQGWNPVALKEKYKDGNSLFAALQGYAQKDIRTLAPDEQSEVHGAYKNLANEPIDNDLLNKIKNSSSGLYKNAAPNRFRKIKGIDNLIWDSVANQVIQINTRQQQQAIQNQPTDLFKGVQTKEDIQNTPISKEGWTSADTADVVSMIGDLVSLGGFWANIGGTATSLTSDLYADISRGKDLGDILKGIGVNLGWGLAGMLPGAKSTRLAVRAARLVPKAFMLAQSAGIVLDPEVQKSALKFTNPSEYKNISSKDLENLKYLFHAVTGGANIAKSHYRAKQYRETINKQEVKTTDGKTVNLSNKEVAEINKAGRKGGQKAAQDKFKEYAKAESAEGQFKFSENGKSKFSPVRYSSNLSKFISNDQLLKGKQVIDQQAINDILQKDAARPWYHINKGYPRFELTPFRNMFRKDFDKSKLIGVESGEESPYAKKPLEQKKVEAKNTEFFSEEKKPNYNRETIKQYKEIMNNKFSNNKLESGNYTIGGEKVQVVKQTDGTFNIIHKGNIIGNYRSQIEVQKQIKNLIKEGTKGPSQNTKPKISAKEMGQILRDLKAKGWLKQGGKITDNDIDNFLKQYK